jgi:aspartate carbamoyltransferase catalytic subunit
MNLPINKISNNFKGKDILSLDQFDPQSISLLFKTTQKMKKIAMNAEPSTILQGNIITLIFYEPSSRTFGSFNAAVKQLGGQAIDILDPQHFSSVTKGETLEDTIRVFEAYCDAIVIRHPNKGIAQTAADAAFFVPIINAGDGIGEHPTQALTDIFTIYEKHGTLENLTGVLAGDMRNGRTIHSLIRALSLYKNNTLYLLSPKELRLTKEDFAEFSARNIKLREISSEKDLPEDAHFWYWTRVQKERFASLAEYEKMKNRFIVTKKLVEEKAGKETIIMHPLPRVGEIAPEVDELPNAVYLRSQIRNGMHIRMALLALVLGKI